MKNSVEANKPLPRQRQSNIELLRIISMFLVLLVHADYFSLGNPTINDIHAKPLDAFLRIFFESVSIVCVNVFVLISGWFGIRPTFKGLSNFLFQCIFFLSGLYIITLLLGMNELSLKGIAGCFFATKLNWFIKAYLLLYILSPVLNAFVETTSRRKFKIILIGFFAFTCTYGWIGVAGFMLQGYTTLFFIGLYLLARYIRIYTPRLYSYSPLTYFFAYACSVIFVTLVEFLMPTLFNYKIPFDLFSYISPTTIWGSLCLLLCFTKINIQNKVINWCAISCFAVFLIHVSPSTLWHFKDFFIWLHNNVATISFWAITFIVLSFIFITAILVDKIRIFVWSKIANKFDTYFNKLNNDYDL